MESSLIQSQQKKCVRTTTSTAPVLMKRRVARIPPARRISQVPTARLCAARLTRKRRNNRQSDDREDGRSSDKKDGQSEDKKDVHWGDGEDIVGFVHDSITERCVSMGFDVDLKDYIGTEENDDEDKEVDNEKMTVMTRTWLILPFVAASLRVMPPALVAGISCATSPHG